MKKFIKLPTLDKSYHYVRVKDIYRFMGCYIRESPIKSTVYLKNGTTLNCTISEEEVFELIKQATEL